jgi:uncharacterized membrane protein
MNKREILTDAMLLFGGWAAGFFGVLVTPENIISLFYKYVFSLLITLAFVILGVMYFRWERFKEKIVGKSIKRRMGIVLITLAELLEAFFAFYTAIINWQVLTINGVPVVTYSNLIFIVIFVTGLFLARDVWRRVRKYWR